MKSGLSMIKSLTLLEAVLQILNPSTFTQAQMTILRNRQVDQTIIFDFRKL